MRLTPTFGGLAPHRRRRAFSSLPLGVALLVALSGDVSFAQSGFTRPAAATSSQTITTRKPTSSDAATPAVLVAVRLRGLPLDVANDVQPILQARAGQRVDRQVVTDDLARLEGLDLAADVAAAWSAEREGWTLTYVFGPPSASDEHSGEDSTTNPKEWTQAAAWTRTTHGWARSLTLHPVATQAPTVRGQSEGLSQAGRTPAPRGSRPLGKAAPTLPRDPEDFGADAAPGVVPVSATSLEEPLVDVRIEGNVTIPVSEIQRHVKTRPGRVATPTSIKEDVDALTRTRWFVSVVPVLSHSDDGLVLTFRVLERPIVRNVEYRGASKVKPEKLAALTNLKVGSPYDVSANRECARRIEEFYHEKGFAFATVTLEKGDHKDDREVVFVIEEGSKVQVVAVRFEGNEFFSDALLNLKLQTKKRILWSFGGKYDPATIPNDKVSVTKYYRGLGFFDMSIDHELRFNADRSQVTIVYNIGEGPRYQIRNVTVEGNDVIPEEVLRADHTITPGEFFTERKLAADVEKMREKYGTLGRIFAKVDAVPIFTEEPGIVDIQYRIDEDKVYRVREFNVHIAGEHPHTRTNLVRNIAQIQPGDLADPKKIQRSKSRLAGSGYFEGGGDLAPRLDISVVDEPGWLQIAAPDTARAQNSPTPSQPPTAQPRMTGYTPTAAGGYTTPKPTTGQRAATKPAPSAAPATKPPAAIRSPQPSVSPLTSARAPMAPSATTTNDSYHTVAATDNPFESVVPPEGIGQLPVDDEELDQPIIRGQDGMLLAQGRGPMPGPQNFLFDNSPQGDPLGNGIRQPDPNDWVQTPPPEYIDIDAYVNEARTGRLMFGVGVNSDAGVIGNIVLSENNFNIRRPPRSFDDIMNGTAWRGNGEKFRIEALPGSEVSRYLVDWQNPYFMDTDVNLGVSGFYYTRFFRFWDEQRIGGRVRLGRQFTPTWAANVSLRMENVTISDEFQPAPQSLADVVGDNFLSTVRLGISHDTRDAAFLPTSGHYVEFGVEQAFAEFTYSRLEVEGRQYFTTYQRPDGGGKHVVNLHGNFGWTSSGTPIFEKFYAGGFQSFRGFAFRGVTPLENGVEVGGEFMLIGSVEYQVPVLANEMLKVVAFSDFGTVEEDVQFDNFRVAVGGGIRIQVPGMGPVPVALDWAVPVVKSEFDRTQLFSFYIGINR